MSCICRLSKNPTLQNCIKTMIENNQLSWFLLTGSEKPQRFVIINTERCGFFTQQWKNILLKSCLMPARFKSICAYDECGREALIVKPVKHFLKKQGGLLFLRSLFHKIM